jgi:hypothetical protein
VAYMAAFVIVPDSLGKGAQPQQEAICRAV